MKLLKKINQKFDEKFKKKFDKFYANELNRRGVLATSEFKKKCLMYSEKGRMLTQKEEAALFAQCMEMQFLKSPSTAVFPSFEEMEITEDNAKYIVSGCVDCQNSYGAIVREQYTYSLLKENDEWKCLNAENTAITALKNIIIRIIILITAIFAISIWYNIQIALISY